VSRVAYLGTSEFAAGILRAVHASAHEVALVVTRPDRPAGRGRRLQSPPVAAAARELDLLLEQPASVNEPGARAKIAATEPDVLVVCAFGALVKEELLDAYEVLNVHPSLLPRWRGAAPVERAIMAGDAETGVAIMRLTLGLDEGPVCAMEPEPIGPDDTYGTLAPRLEALGARLLLQALDGPREYAEQPGEGVTYAEKITAADRLLDPQAPGDVNERVVRALSPHIGARLELRDGSLLGVRRARARGLGEGVEAGTLAARDGALLWGDLELLEVQPPGGKPMPADAYVRGHLR
jgi:methionyl-tRNA formyltransferase